MTHDYREASPSRSMLRPWKRELFEDQLVDDAIDSRFDNAALRVDASAMKWSKGYDRIARLATPHGALGVFRSPAGWKVTRDAVMLLHPRSQKPALFSTKRSAQAAALLHMADGFDDAVHLGDGLTWELPPAMEPRCGLPIASSQPREFPNEHELTRLLERLIARLQD